MIYSNIGQRTYDKLLALCDAPGDSWARAKVAKQDLRDLLAAFASAIELLDECQNIGIDHSTHRRNVEDFLYLASGEPRLVVESPEAKTHALSDFPLPDETPQTIFNAKGKTS